MDRALVGQRGMTPRATYRLQFNQRFGFADASAIAPYLARLGVSHVYASPWLKARPGSAHGYDIVDHQALNPELGSEADFQRMVHTFRENGLRQILDFVPNHMGVGGADNPFWLDVLEWGQDSPYAGWFDIDWHSDRSYLENKLLVPFLGDQYGVELYAGKLVLKFDRQDGSFAVWAYDTHKLPICPLHYGRILGDQHPELERLGDAFLNLPEWHPQVARRARELKSEVARLAANDDSALTAILAAVERYRGEDGNEESWGALGALMQDQHWHAANFRVAADDINYRRFFNINDLAGLRMEVPEVFDHSHALVLRLLANGTLHGLRIDHVDGLLNPKEYLQKLAAFGAADKVLYLVVEKILAQHELLREDWPVDGTTGYEFTNLVLSLLIDSSSEEAISQSYVDFTGERSSFDAVVRECKLRIMRNEMVSELNVLARQAADVAHQNPKTADFTQNVLRRAIREVIACFPVYRTYVDWEGTPTSEDRRDLNWAVKQARTHEVNVDSSVFDFVAGVCSGDLVAGSRSGFSRHGVLRLAMKIQQYSGPVMAKGLEDTAFYRYNRFIALNEVGGHPDRFGASLTSFHKANTQRAKRWPRSMVSTSTHDTKRGEDTRARLAVLSELPAEWTRLVKTWSRILRARRGDVEGSGPPDRNDEYMFYQLLLGTWPAELTGCNGNLDQAALSTYRERVKAAMTKSIREAKSHSSWVAPNVSYEAAVSSFVEGALHTEESGTFLSSFLPFQERIAQLGVHNSLVQTTLKLTVPGVPDLYQGAELWDLNMVDPDNRRSVDFETRVRMLAGFADREDATHLLQHWNDGAIKLLLTARLLALRAAEPDVFLRGDYEPLLAVGAKSDRLCAFARRHAERMVIVVTARFPALRATDPGWDDTTLTLPSGFEPDMVEILSGARIPVHGGELDTEAALGRMPVAIFAPERKAVDNSLA